ncbi:hypothetical protein PMALA_081780 [Plasmodium malariae]|uniref:Uncharacterized protein n=1 Tax=Plasmodium malariae TaxID=5858 RepID=A0A1A8XC74_PLAMA|nr:hypothetical protein PMALA_081780 [Plasmodium malariae]
MKEETEEAEEMKEHEDEIEEKDMEKKGELIDTPLNGFKDHKSLVGIYRGKNEVRKIADALIKNLYTLSDDCNGFYDSPKNFAKFFPLYFLSK